MHALPGVVASLVLGLLLGAEVLRRLLSVSESGLADALTGASHLWLAGAVCGYSICVFGAPFRLYWRRDSKLLSSLPIPGSSLFTLCVWRSHRSALLVSLALVCALPALGVGSAWEIAVRHLAVVAIGFAGSAWLAPAAALAAGSIVASDKAQALISSMGGEFQAPKTSWLGIFPGVAATIVAIALISCSPWALGERPPGGSIALILGLSLGLSGLSLLWAWRRADAVVPLAIREVAALDQEILAHIDRSHPSSLEKAWFSGTLGSGIRGVLARKDATLSRRRYPSPYFMIPCGIAALWIVAASRPESYLPWGGAFFAGLLVYAVVMARRIETQPVEIPTLIKVLALSHADIRAAKRSQNLLRITFIVVLGGLPLILAAPQQLSTAIFVVVTSLLAIVMTHRR